MSRDSRFTMSGSTLSTASETALVDEIPAPSGLHNGGDLEFGKDAMLVGDGTAEVTSSSPTATPTPSRARTPRPWSCATGPRASSLHWSEWFAGLIDDVRVYSRALSAAEILRDMQTPVG